MVDEALMTKKASIFSMVGTAWHKGVREADDWLEKWEGHYKIIRDDSGDDDSVHDMDIICTEEAYTELVDEINAASEWTNHK
ncbi:MAG: hypothetical protein AAF569_06060 [Pseudomonadota bacterium]